MNYILAHLDYFETIFDNYGQNMSSNTKLIDGMCQLTPIIFCLAEIQLENNNDFSSDEDLVSFFREVLKQKNELEKEENQN